MAETENKLHPYRVFVIDLFYLENWLYSMALINGVLGELDRKKELIDFLQKYIPDDDWNTLYVRYMSSETDKPSLQELIQYHRERGLSITKIRFVLKKDRRTIDKYKKGVLIQKMYKEDKLLRKLYEKFQRIKPLLNRCLFDYPLK